MEPLTNLTNLLSNTNLVNQLPNLKPDEVENIAKNLFSEYGWMFAAGVAVILIKDVMMNFAKGILIFYGSDFNNDDIIYISGRQARIVRVGVTSTTFYMSDRKTKMVVPNEQLKELTIEKTLGVNGGSPYLPKGGDPEFNPKTK
jgi:hypothetical protein|tara:strand:- start:638 stop:1069 length:432 start_codon:yes stop_codon:yes gene_type:complete